MSRGRWFVKQGLILTIISFLMAGLSFVKEAVFANYFGSSEMADAFTVAIQIPEILFSIVWNAINVIVIPLYTEKYCNEGKQNATAFISNLITLFSAGAIILLIFGEIFTDYIVFFFSPGLNNETHDLAVSLMRCIFPILFFEGIIRISNGVLNVHKKFIIPKLLNSIRNVGIIVFLVLFTKRFGIFAAAYGFLSGIVAECISFLLFTSKFEKYNLRINIKDPALHKAGKMTVPVIWGIGASEINQIADKIVASFLDSGSIVNLNYASKLSSIIETIFLSNIVTLMYPTYSRLIATGKEKELAKTYTETINITCILGIPIVFGGLFLSREIVTLAFQRGAFDENTAILVGKIFACYLLGSMFSTIRLIGVKLFTAFCDTKTPMINSIIGSFLNIILNIFLSHFLGAPGLALATTISTGVVGFLLLKKAKERVKAIEYETTKILLVKSSLAALVMCFVLYFLKVLLLNSHRIGILTFTIITVIGCMGVYFLMLCLLKVSEVKQVLNMIKTNKFFK